MKQNISEFIHGLSITDLLKELISIDTQNPAGNEMDIIEFIISYLQLQENQYEIIYHGNNRGSMILTIPGTDEGKVVLLGHMDTVPAADISFWKHHPLSGHISGNKMYGIGTSDMKSGLAVLLIVAEYLLKYGGNRKTICFIFTADEECGCTGAKAVREKGYTDDAGMIIVAEPTDGNVAVAEKGVMWIQIKAVGRQAHGAMPQLGINAIEYLWSIISSLKMQIEKMEKSIYMGKVTVSTTIFRGGEKSNIIPKQAEAILDIRTVRKNNHMAIRKFLGSVIEKMGQQSCVDVTYDIINEKYPLEGNSSEQIQNLLKCSPERSEVIYIPYYTDLAELLRNHITTFAVLGPGDIEQMHKTNEWVNLDKINTVVEHYINYIVNYC